MKTLTTILTAGLLLLTGCGSGEDTDDHTTGRDRPTEGITEVSTPHTRLLEAKERWADSDTTRYEWTYERQCFCPALTARIDVDGDTVVSWKNLADRSDDHPPEILTMDDLFDQVETALNESEKVTVTYDPETGAYADSRSTT